MTRIRVVREPDRPDRAKVIRVHGPQHNEVVGRIVLLNGRHFPSRVGYKPTHSYLQLTVAVRHLLLNQVQDGGREIEYDPRGQSPIAYGKELPDEEEAD